MEDKFLCHIIFPFREGPWGGCNQFLTALRDELRLSGNWTDSPFMADVILFDSFNDARQVVRWKRLLPAIPFIHRVDGPISTYRGGDRYIDRLIHVLGEYIADGVIFQSKYSMSANLCLGMPLPAQSVVINNAANKDYFWPRPKSSSGDRIRLIAVSWSSHRNKGFDIYSHLDLHLDFTRYTMTFVGNSPVSFKNIHHVPPQDLSALAEFLRDSDIYLTASRHESCSNSLLEALACGLPAVAINSGGNPEVLASGGALFSDASDVVTSINMVASKISTYRAAIIQRNISDVASDYIAFLKQVRMEALPAKRLTAWQGMFLSGYLLLRRFLTGRDRILQLSARVFLKKDVERERLHAPD